MKISDKGLHMGNFERNPIKLKGLEKGFVLISTRLKEVPIDSVK